MEKNLLPRPAVRREIEKRFVEVWLHSDHPTLGDQWVELQRAMVGFQANPYFVVIEAATRKVLRKHDYTKDEAEFIRFLKGE